MRALSKIAEDWWDYTTLDHDLLDTVASLSIEDLAGLERPGFSVAIYDTLEEFYLAEALEYIEAWKQATSARPAGICGPIGPTEHLPLVARLVNEMNLDLSNAHFWGMDEWCINGKAATTDFPLSFELADRGLCFGRIRKDLAIPEQNLHFPRHDNLADYTASFDEFRCVIMQGGQGETKHWAFNDPLKREGAYKDLPPSPEDFLKLGARKVDLHPLTLAQNARTSGGGRVHMVPNQAYTVGPLETFKAECVSIWHPGHHDNPFGMRLTAYMISHRIVDTTVPMSLLGLHENVRFSFYRSGLGSCDIEMH